MLINLLDDLDENEIRQVVNPLLCTIEDLEKFNVYF